MPYDTLADLPEDVKNALPEEAQKMWLEAYNSADEGGQQNPAAIAWAAVKQSYEQDMDGNWIAKRYKIMKKNDYLRYTLGVAYPANEVDKDEHYASEEVVRDAAWGFMEKLQHVDEVTKLAKSVFVEFVKVAKGDADVSIDVTKMDVEGIEKTVKDMHEEEVPDAKVVESYVSPVDFTLEGEEIKKGDWLVGVVWNEEIFEKVLSGERVGYSIAGKGVSIDK